MIIHGYNSWKGEVLRKKSSVFKFNIGGKQFVLPLPRSRFMRCFFGYAFILGGLFGFLPVLGFWMLPVGVLILSHDSPRIRRWRRKMETRLLRKWRALRRWWVSRS